MDTADRLIESTRELLWERGYVGTSPKAILQRSGAGQGSMYHHFTGKPDLALAAERRTVDEMRTTVDALLSGHGTARERIAVYLRRERDVLRGCPVGRLTMDPDVVASPELRAPVEELFTWLRGRLTALVAEGQASGEFAPGLDPADTAAAIAATLQGGYVLARASESVEPFDRAVSGILALLGPTP
ncbi:TetR/AcrR family transcriptional regulator [Streptantibioticus parmotrematis]|uniref:TetR/AcrR family transcriptional regulator n=1 Tax=Streptantibioticus parmotrematis TaxID=2873249 RepID=UPI00340CA20E